MLRAPALIKKIIPAYIRERIRNHPFYQFVWEQINGVLSIIQMIIWINNRNRNLRFQNRKLPWGINVISLFDNYVGLGVAAQGSLAALKHTDIPFLKIIRDFSEIELVTHKKILPFDVTYNVNLIHVNPPEYPLLWKRFGPNLLVKPYNIGVWYWELSNIPSDWKVGFDVLDEVWVATKFVLDAVKDTSPIPVFKVPPVVYADFNDALSRQDFNLPNNVFLFLCAYDAGSVSERKNPLGAIKAFKQAFPVNNHDVGLVIKVRNSMYEPAALELLRTELIDYKNSYFIFDTFSKKEFNTLLNLSDVFISLHRSEGFGLIPAEAMYLGKPVIMTDWSGNTDFMTKENCCPVDYRLIPIQKNNFYHKYGGIWADPDVSHAAEYMQKLFFNKSYYHTISSNAPLILRSNYSTEKIADIMTTRMMSIRQQIDSE